MIIDELTDILHREKCSCVIYNRGKKMICHERGVKDLYRLLKSDKSVLEGAVIADKVIGKGAAALMILGGVSEVYADVISRPAMDLLSSVSIPVSYGVCVSNIIDRNGTGVCPVETLCIDCESAIDCLPLIERFVKEITERE